MPKKGAKPKPAAAKEPVEAAAAAPKQAAKEPKGRAQGKKK